ncbi:TetR/AcrR family transcriptional regulator [Bacillus massiliglaciei]|uniref:TetR/AcrR family transcriptional regulator n=1 Tax=Bacillus massiliglaciei TaxID=1816693 RepID=UPI000DA61021|nr:TetR/AcrR family transcriptional regulator [Bacillus massiliglaciei]
MARLKGFNQEQVLNKAMLVFWEKGYQLTSIPDLLHAMEISRSSLYETFIDKQTLYCQTIDHYKKMRSEKKKALLNAPTVKKGIKSFFAMHIELAYSEDFPKGCLITNAAISLSSPDEKFNQLVKESFDDLENTFYEVLKKGQASGEIDQAKDIHVLSCLLLNLNHSINVLSKVKKDKEVLYDMIETILELL